MLGEQQLGDIILGDEGEEELTSPVVHGQAQARILATYNAHGQAQARILTTYNAYGQSQAQIKQTYYATGQSNALIGTIYREFGQAQARILTTYDTHGQSQAQIKQTYYVTGQSNAAIVNTYFASGQAGAYIIGLERGFGQAQARVLQTYNVHGQAQGEIADDGVHSYVHGQAQAYIFAVKFLDTFTRSVGSVTTFTDLNSPDIGRDYISNDLANFGTVSINGTQLQLSVAGTPDYENLGIYKYGERYYNFEVYGDFYQSAASDFATYAYISLRTASPFGVVDFVASSYLYDGDFYLNVSSPLTVPFTIVPNTTYRLKLQRIGAVIKAKIWDISGNEPEWMLTDAISTVSLFPEWYSDAGEGPSGPLTVTLDNLTILSDSVTYHVQGQARAFIVHPRGYGQARARIKTTNNRHGQARARIIDPKRYAQAQARIKQSYPRVAQAQALITSAVKNVYGQANALIDSTAKVQSGQANAKIINPSYYIVDTFTRTGNLAVVPTPDVGLDWHAYDLFSGNEDSIDFAELDGANLTVTGNNDYRYIWPHNDSVTSKNIDIYTEITYNNSADYFEIDAREIVGKVAYLSYVFPGVWFLNSLEGASSITASQSYPLVVGQRYSIRYTLRGSEHRFKIWLWENSEPETWTLILQGGPSPEVGEVGTWMEVSDTAVTNYMHVFIAKEAGFEVFGQAQALILSGINVGYGTGQAQAYIKGVESRSGQAQARIHRYELYGQTQARIKTTYHIVGQSNAYILRRARWFGQAQATIAQAMRGYGQAQAIIGGTNGLRVHGQAQAYIKDNRMYGQAQAFIRYTRFHGQAQARILKAESRRGFGQAQARIGSRYAHGQAQGYIKFPVSIHGLARAVIAKTQGSGQAQAKILAFGQRASGNAQAYIRRTDTNIKNGQAQASIRRSDPVGQAQAFIEGGRYLVKYNGYQLPGWAGAEDISSITKVLMHDPAYEDTIFSEYTGLDNKIVSMSHVVRGETYLAAKEQVQQAFTIVRSKKGWAKLYIQRGDRYYQALTAKISTGKTVGSSMRLLGYETQFEVKPWLIGDEEHILTGTGTIDTDQVGRTVENGGWTPSTIVLTGENITVSGYTVLGDFAGYISVSGAVTNLVIDTEMYTATMNGINSNEYIRNANYAMYVGPIKTIFEIDGATDCTITYHDRWYL